MENANYNGKLIKDRGSNIKRKGKITLQTGYGPSG